MYIQIYTDTICTYKYVQIQYLFCNCLGWWIIFCVNSSRLRGDQVKHDFWVCLWGCFCWDGCFSWDEHLNLGFSDIGCFPDGCGHHPVCEDLKRTSQWWKEPPFASFLMICDVGLFLLWDGDLHHHLFWFSGLQVDRITPQVSWVPSLQMVECSAFIIS